MARMDDESQSDKVDKRSVIRHSVPMRIRTLHDEQHERQLIKQVFEMAQERLNDLNELLPYQMFYDHIKAHFEKEHPDWKVKCKICNKTFEEIVNAK